MNKALLTATAAIYFLAAIALLFAPAELLQAAGEQASGSAVAVLQLLGSALFGFAMFNWMQRYSAMGGIFGRHLVVANLAHAATAALLLGHLAIDRQLPAALLPALAIYSAIAIAFGLKLLLPPRRSRQDEA
jgi:hypothetical protein